MNDESIEKDIRNYDLFKWLFALFLALVLAILLLQGCLSKNVPTPELNAPQSSLVAGEPVTLSGRGDAGYDVAVLANSKRIGVADVGEDGTWSLVTNALSQAGDYEITLQAIDREGNQLVAMDEAVLLTLGSSMADSSGMTDGDSDDDMMGDADLVSAESADQAEMDSEMSDASMSEDEMVADSGSESSMSDSDEMTDDSAETDANTNSNAMSDSGSAAVVDTNSNASDNGDASMSDSSMSDSSSMNDEDDDSSMDSASMDDDSDNEMNDDADSADADDNNNNEDSDSMVAKIPTIDGVDVTVGGTSSQVDVRGSADPLTALRLFYQEFNLGTVTSDANGYWKWTGQVTVKNGDELVVQALNNEGEVIAISPTYPLIIEEMPAMADTDGDADATERMVALRWEDAERNAVVSGGPILLAGRGTPDTDLAILIGTTEIARVTVDGNGEWMYSDTLPTMAEGSYDLRAVALDADGKFTDSAGLLTFTIGADDGSDAITVARPTQSVSTVALNDSNFSVLARALEALDMVDVLDGNGPFTVFAPTNEAFAKWPSGELELLLRNHPEVLINILQYHVVSGEYNAAQVGQAGSLNTLAGDSIDIEASGSGVAVNGANVVQGDVLDRNGVIHAIDEVLLPPFDGAPPQILSTSPSVQASQKMLTVSGTGEPGLKMLIELDGRYFGQAIIGSDGTWAMTGVVNEAGTYEIVAFECTYNEVLLAVSSPVTVVVD